MQTPRTWACEFDLLPPISTLHHGVNQHEQTKTACGRMRILFRRCERWVRVSVSLIHYPFCFWWGGFTSRCALPCTCRKSLETFFKLMKLCEMLGAGRYHTSTYCPYKGTQAVPMNARPLAVQLEIKRQQAEAQRSKKKGGSGGS